MATKVKPTRLQITGTPQSGDVPMYVSPDCFCRGQGGGGGTVVGPSSSCDGDLAIFCGTCGDCIVDSGKKLCDYAKCCDLPDMSCYQQVCNLVCDLSGADDTHYPSAKAVADAIQCAGGGDMMKSVYDPNNCNSDAFDYCNFSNTPDMNCYQEKLTAGNNISINTNTISGNFNYAEPDTAAACTTKCVCIPEITQLCVGQQITIKPTITNTACATDLKLNNFTAYPIRYNGTALTSSTDGYVRGAGCLATLMFDGTYWQTVSKSYDTNTTYTLNTMLDAGKYTAGTGTYALSRYSLVMEKDDGTWEKITNTAAAYSTATTKTVNTNGFRLNHIRYYVTTTNVATGALIATNTLANQYPSIDLRYSTNCGGTTTWAEGDYIYLVGTIKSDGLFYLDTTQWWTNTLPTTKDGKLYIRIGIVLAAAGYTASFLIDRPIYYYDGGLKLYEVADNKQDLLVSGTNIKTVNGCTLLGSGDVCIQGGVTSVNGCTGDVCLTIPTDNCQLSNGCGYTTCTGTLSTCSDITTALGFTPVQSCDIPTDNCQLSNGCGYTTCTGTVTSADLACYAQCCDIPSVSGFVQESCIACINGCCLTQGGDICIQGGGGIENLPGSPVCICYKWTGDMCAYCALGTYRCDTEYNVYE